LARQLHGKQFAVNPMIVRPALVEDARGIALVHVSSWQRAYRAVVWVLAANERAIRFYERAGFTLSSTPETVVEIGGEKLPAVRYEIAIA
jgi:RimJ/RimL family protein N-acetyltransferase